jgi:hypothetical protein
MPFSRRIGPDPGADLALARAQVAALAARPGREVAAVLAGSAGMRASTCS